ncbi:hypothetical protein, partial [uncultured Muribaculum sp.]|uniref:hypothetical protein n=1 Tax=uncultured Muribaculum sp. TaxID=1918613 RepID=UPI002711D608
SFAHKNAAAGEARRVFKQKSISGDLNRQVAAGRMPFTASGLRCSGHRARIKSEAAFTEASVLWRGRFTHERLYVMSVCLPAHGHGI